MKQSRRKENIVVKLVRIMLIILLLPIVLFILTKNFVAKIKENKRNKEKIEIYNIAQLDALNGEEFEMLLKSLFEKCGYEVVLTKKSHDYGADLVLKRKEKVVIVQAKCYSQTVGVKAVQEIIGAKVHYDATYAMVITNNYFSKEAEILAIENNVNLLDRDALINLMSKYKVYIEKKKNNYSAISTKSVAEIESKFSGWI